MRFAILGLCAAIALSGCMQVTSENVSANPTRVAIAKSAVQGLMKDPESTRFGDGYQAYQLSNGDDVICGSLNAKNSYGGYVGYNAFYVRFRGEQVMFVATSDRGEIACNNAMSGSFNVRS